MTNCPSCGTQNRFGARVCRNCRFPLQSQPPIQQPIGGPLPPPVPNYPPPSQQFAPQKWWQKIFSKQVGYGCLLLFVGFWFGVLMIFLYQSINDNSGKTAGERPEKDAPTPSFKLKTYDDKEIDFPKALENKPGVLVFWNVDAKIDEQMNKLQALARDKDLRVYVVDPKDNKVAVRNGIQGKGWDKITFLIDGDQSALEKYQAKLADLPIYFLIGKDGKLTDNKLPNATKTDELEKKINEQLLK